MADATIDAAEVEKFDRMAADWWDPKGSAAPLHAMNPVRLDYACAQIAAQFDRDRGRPAPFAGLSILDVGCGPGLVAEPMARLGADVTGVDASEEAVGAARAHAETAGLALSYRVAAAEALVAEGAGFDVVLALEIVEHTPDPAAFLRALAALTKPGGLAILSTLNRTPASFMKAILGAEYVLRWLPPGTHDWRRFLPPDALADMAAEAGLCPVDRCGMVYAPFADRWRLDRRDLSVNYLLSAEKPAA